MNNFIPIAMPASRPTFRFNFSRRGFILVSLLMLAMPGLAQQISWAPLMAPFRPSTPSQPKPSPPKPSPLASPKTSQSKTGVNSAQHQAISDRPVSRWKIYTILTFVLIQFIWISILTWWIISQIKSLKGLTQNLQDKHAKNKDSIIRVDSSAQRVFADKEEVRQDLTAHKASTARSFGSLEAKLQTLQEKLEVLETKQTTHPSPSTVYVPNSPGHDPFASPGTRGFNLTSLQKSTINSHSEADSYFSESQPKSDPAQELASFFQDAFYRNDRIALRALNPEEMIITEETEDNLVRRTANMVIQLQVVNGGGSYLLIHKGGAHWLVPTFQTLSSFTHSQPAKRIFRFQPESVSCAELRCPAEVKEVGGLWQITAMGIVAIPA